MFYSALEQIPASHYEKDGDQGQQKAAEKDFFFFETESNLFEGGRNSFNLRFNQKYK